MAAAADPRTAAGLLLLVAGVMAPACATGRDTPGQRLYKQHGCAVCHGAAGQGDGPAAKRLAAPPRDFADRNGYRQGGAADDIARSIRNGAGAMPPFRDLTEVEARDIAAWIVTLQRDTGTASTAGVTVQDAWVRESTAARTSSSGYCTIRNHGDAAVKLVKVVVESAGSAKLHEMADQDGHAVMRQIDVLKIPARGTVALTPGSTHVMLTDIAVPLRAGSTVGMTMTFDDGHAASVQAVVRPLSATSAR